MEELRQLIGCFVSGGRAQNSKNETLFSLLSGDADLFRRMDEAATRMRGKYKVLSGRL